MTISLTQAILLGLFCGIAKCCIPYTAGAFMYNTVIFNAVIVGAVLGDMPHAMMIGASLQLIYLGVIAAGGNQPTDPCLAAYVAIPVAMASGLNTNAAVALAVPVGLLGVQISNLLYLAAGFFAPLPKYNATVSSEAKHINLISPTPTIDHPIIPFASPFSA